jgi:phage baseplate assembly protein gpV
MVEVIRKIVESEIRKIHVAEIGVVTSIFPHSSDSDKDNYECNVKLKYKDFELRKVPVATQHIGLANTPNIGDLVLVSFVNGDINSPVVVGRLYTDEDRPPPNKEEEVVYIPPYSKESGLRRVHMEFPSGIILTVTDDDVAVEVGKTTLKVDLDGDITVESNANINVGASGDLYFSAGNITMESSNNMEFKAGANHSTTATGNIKTESTGNTEHKATGSLKIEGTGGAEVSTPAVLTLKGSMSDLSGSAVLNIKGGLVKIN